MSKDTGLRWCDHCKKVTQSHDGGGYLYGIWMPCPACNICGYSTAFSPRQPAPAKETSDG